MVGKEYLDSVEAAILAMDGGKRDPDLCTSDVGAIGTAFATSRDMGIERPHVGRYI